MNRSSRVARTVVVALVCSLVLSGCKTGQIAALSILGAVAAGAIAYSIVSQLNRADQQRHTASLQEAAEYGQVGDTIRWQSADSGASGSITPLSGPVQSNGRTCRRIQQSVNVGGQDKSENTVACRQSSGSWALS